MSGTNDPYAAMFGGGASGTPSGGYNPFPQGMNPQLSAYNNALANNQQSQANQQANQQPTQQLQWWQYGYGPTQSGAQANALQYQPGLQGAVWGQYQPQQQQTSGIASQQSNGGDPYALFNAVYPQSMYPSYLYPYLSQMNPNASIQQQAQFLQLGGGSGSAQIPQEIQDRLAMRAGGG